MQLRADQLSAHLARARTLPAVVVVCGDDALLTQEAADALRAAARAAGYAERQVFNLAGAHADWSGALAEARSPSLFADRRVVELRLPSGKPGKDGSTALQRYCEAPPEDVLLMLLLPRLDRDQLKSAWFTALDGRGLVVRVDPVERDRLGTWLAQRLAAQGQRVADGEEGQRTLAFFVERVEGNLLAAHQEVQKLGLLHPPGCLSLAQVQQAVLNVARYDVFKLGEAVLSAQVGRALRMLDGLRAEGEAAVLVHWTMAEDLRVLRRVLEAVAKGLPLAAALQQQRVWGPRERLMERAAQRVSPAALAELLQAASVCDGIVKGLRHPLWPADPWRALRRLALMTMQALRAGSPPLVLGDDITPAPPPARPAHRAA